MRLLQSAALSTVIAFISLATLNSTAQGQSLPWSYTLDSPNDSLGVDANGNIQPGGSIYEIFGMAVKDDIATDSIWFAFSANLPLYGDNLPNPYLDADSNGDGNINLQTERYPVPDSNIGWGDLFLDFSGTGNLVSASNTNQLFGIKFSINNDSRVPIVETRRALGIYNNVSLASVTTTNAGYSNLANNNNRLFERSGRTANMGDLAWNSSYFAPYASSGTLMPNVIRTGDKIGEVTLLNQENLEKAGLDSSVFNAPTGEIFGFRIPKALLPAGEFIATVLTECINDGISMVSRLAPPLPPQPPQPYVCPVTMGQQNALMPTYVSDGVKIFENAPSGAWFDPPATMGFQFFAQGDSLFTGISGFPCAILPDDPIEVQKAPFEVLLKNEGGEYEILGQYYPGQSVDFTGSYPNGVSEFVIQGINSRRPPGDLYEEPDVPLAFALLLNQETATVAMRKITDASTSPSPVLEAISLEYGDPSSLKTIDIPGITVLPDVKGPDLNPPCLRGGRCGSEAVPEPSTLTGLGLAIAGILKLRRDRRQ